MANRLAGETSPYLLQHKDNPVDWYPWGEEAFALAREEDKPVFLSVGYSSCHWCHVMEHESFENDALAAVLNEFFVSVKVDREERPDVDEAYMTAVQLSSGRGGWPMTVFLTPAKQPFFAGTYFPREDRGAQPGFQTICRQIASLWKSKRQEIEENAAEFAVGLSETIGRKAPSTFARFDEALIESAVRAHAADFDEANGGFGNAPKFPPHTSIDFLLRYASRPGIPEELLEIAVGMALATLEQMALGGIRDHVGGGFHRYSTDAEWLLPHFEKMLYDNALMIGNFWRAAEMLKGIDKPLDDLLTQACTEAARWVMREMTAPEMFFYSALDADSEGEEGKFYTWTVAEARSILGDRADAFLARYGLQEAGNFRDEATGRQTGANIPHLSEPPAEGEVGLGGELKQLLGAREKRVRPGLDNKVLISWNGLMIRGMAESTFLKYAADAADALLGIEQAHGRLPHQVVGGKPSGTAFLDDYAAFADGLFAVARKRVATEAMLKGAPSDASKFLGAHSAEFYRDAAERLTQEMIDLFWDDEEGGFFSTSPGHEELFGRSKSVFDSPTPSANALALRCLIELGDLERANRLVAAFLGWMERAPQATEALYAAAMELMDRQSEGQPESRGPAEQAAPAGEVLVSLEPREIRVGPDGVGRGEVVIAIPEGLHINSSSPPARWLTPTELKFQPVKAEVSYPVADEDVYRGQVAIPFEVALPAGSRGEEFEVRVSYQACTDAECQLPAEKILSGVVVPG